MNRPGRLFPFALLVIVFAVVLGGCGEDPDVAYQHDLRGIGNQVASALDRVPTNTDTPVESHQIRVLAERLRVEADSLDELDAPGEDAKRAQRMFVRGLRGVATALIDLSHDLDASSDETKQAERFVQFATDDSIQKSFADLENAQDAFARAGFRLFEDPSAAAPPHVGTATTTAG